MFNAISKEVLLKRGRCCGLGCYNCPWIDDNNKKNDENTSNTKDRK